MTVSAKQNSLFSVLEQAYETGIATKEQSDQYFSMLIKGFPYVGRQVKILRSINRFVDTDIHSTDEMFYRKL